MMEKLCPEALYHTYKYNNVIYFKYHICAVWFVTWLKRWHIALLRQLLSWSSHHIIVLVSWYSSNLYSMGNYENISSVAWYPHRDKLISTSMSVITFTGHRLIYKKVSILIRFRVGTRREEALVARSPWWTKMRWWWWWWRWKSNACSAEHNKNIQYHLVLICIYIETRCQCAWSGHHVGVSGD